MITVGQDLSDAEKTLKNAGFELEYDSPIDLTGNEDYLHQLVIIGETRPNSFETFAYAAGWSWMPFTHSESPYVKIDADRNGKIIAIE